MSGSKGISEKREWSCPLAGNFPSYVVGVVLLCVDWYVGTVLSKR